MYGEKIIGLSKKLIYTMNMWLTTQNVTFLKKPSSYSPFQKKSFQVRRNLNVKLMWFVKYVLNQPA